MIVRRNRYSYLRLTTHDTHISINAGTQITNDAYMHTYMHIDTPPIHVDIANVLRGEGTLCFFLTSAWLYSYLLAARNIRYHACTTNYHK